MTCTRRVPPISPGAARIRQFGPMNPALQSRGSTDVGVEKNAVVFEDRKGSNVELAIVGAGVVADKLVVEDD